MSTNLSVIIPTWNRADTLEGAVRSALAQTLPPLEILVCDDGSTDDSMEIVKSIRDDRVKWIEGSRSGRPAVPRNRGIKISQGEWLAFLDSDDKWHPEKIERQLDHAEKLKCLAVCSNAYRIVQGKGITGLLLNISGEKISFSDILHLNHVICSSALIHKSLLELIEGFPEDPQLKAIEDYALWLRVATRTDFAFVKDPLLDYQDDANDSIRSENASIWVQRLNVLKNFVDWSKRHDIHHEFLFKVKRKYYISALLSKASLLADLFHKTQKTSP
jgi:glycosyltransferase involved in cell wall biosynthesis